jgi:tRNA(Leu) C34 or U34 (ribose-2'-O)-methylase TrmL
MQAANAQQSYIGLTNPKSPTNVGSVLRAAGCFGAEEIFYSGSRYDIAKKFHTDTHTYSNEIALTHCDDFYSILPKNAQMVCVELVEGATPLPEFVHPDNALYLFGPEDSTLTQDVVSRADHVVYLPTRGCLNLAATVNVVLYDRVAKLQSIESGDELIRNSRDRNNATKV